VSDLESRLRAMLQERAGDITTLPERILPAPSDEEVLDTRRRGAYRPRTGWLVAAAIAAVLAVAGAVVATRGRDRSAPPPATHTTTVPHPTPTPAPANHAPRKVKLVWFGMQKVAGFDERIRLSGPGYRTLAVRSRNDKDLPVGCNGCEIASDYVLVFDRGAFDAGKYRVQTWSRSHVAGHTAYVGTMPWYGAKDHVVATIAWQFGPGEWALVQGVTPLGGRTATLKRLAAAVRPTTSVPIELPFRLDYVPDAPITQITDYHREGYALSMDFSTGRTDGLSFDVTLWNGTSFAGRYTTSTATRSNVGGLPGWIGEEGIAVRYHGGIAVFGVSIDGELGTTVGDRAAEARLNAERQVALERLARGIHWTNGDGRAPYAKAEDAIP
jgi:hypothetical protein